MSQTAEVLEFDDLAAPRLTDVQRQILEHTESRTVDLDVDRMLADAVAQAGADVALKLFGRPGEATRPEDQWWFQEEARALAGLNHPAIVRARDFGALPDGTPYLVMDAAPGRSLHEWIYLAQHDGLLLCAHRVHQNQTSDRCLRSASLGIVPVAATAQLPDFSADAFCLGCHHADAQIEGLKLGALLQGGVPSREDPRRRPMFWPAAVVGDQYDDPFSSTTRLAGWGLCDGASSSCTALDDTLAPGDHKWFFP